MTRRPRHEITVSNHPETPHGPSPEIVAEVQAELLRRHLERQRQAEPTLADALLRLEQPTDQRAA